MKFSEIYLNLVYLPHLLIFKYLKDTIFPWSNRKYVTLMLRPSLTF